MENYLKDNNLYLIATFVVMTILFSGSSQTCEQQPQVGLLDRLLGSHSFEEQLRNTSFQYTGSEVSIRASGYNKFIELFIRKGIHFGMYFLLDGSWFIGLVSRIRGLFLTAVVSWLATIDCTGLDEFHQMITDGRTPLLQDAMLDVMGALTTIVICPMVRGLRKSKRKKH